MTRHTTFCFTLLPTAAQEQALWRHAGAARFAYNQSLGLVKNALEARRGGSNARVPWTGFDLINAFNRWKRSSAAGVDEHGEPGLAWRTEVCQQVFEEGAVDLGRGLAAFSSRGANGSRTAGFPRFKKRSDGRQSFRIRNKGREVLVGTQEVASCVRLPKLGLVALRECTRKLRRMVAKGRAKILFATVSHEIGGHWRLSVNVEAAAFHPAQRPHEHATQEPVGIDRGLQTFAVLADASGHEVERITAPRPLRGGIRKLRRSSRSVSRKKKGSRNRYRARVRLARHHRRIGNIRRDFVHRATSRLANTHGHLVLETLSTAGLMRTRMARSLADSAWSMFGRVLAYKLSWRGGTLSLADRFYPSTRRCSGCGHIGDALPLSERTFCCRSCGHEADRDTNAAASLAQYPGLSWPSVAAKQAETINACREESAGAWVYLTRGTVLGEAGRASA